MKKQMTEEIQAEILEKYRSKKTPEGRRELIRQKSMEHGIDQKVIARFLLDNGQQVDGRILRYEKDAKPTAPDLSAPGWKPLQEVARDDPEPAAETQQDEPERCEPAAEREPAMTAGVLAALLNRVDEYAPVVLDGSGDLRFLHVSVTYNTAGELDEAVVVLHAGE